MPRGKGPYTVECPGCKKVFKERGYASHLAQSSNVACIAIREARESVYTPPVAQEAPPFFEDHFGNTYNEDDFMWEDPELELLAGPDEQEIEEQSDDDDDENDDVDIEGYFSPDWEPSANVEDVGTSDNEPMEEDDPSREHHAEHQQAHQHLQRKVVVVKFPNDNAGAPVISSIRNSHLTPSAQNAYEGLLMDGRNDTNPYAPFSSKLDWEVAKWAKLRGPGETAFTELLGIEGVLDTLQLSYKNARELNKLVDKLPPCRPRFSREEIMVAGQTYDLYTRDILECIKALYGDPEFISHLTFAPERHYLDDNHLIRLYSDMHTGKWWWSTQLALEKDHAGATIVPIILSSDKTQLTLFRNKNAYPVYMTIGNLPKEIRRKPSRHGQVLVGYLPAARFDHIKSPTARRRVVANVFHACMRHIVERLKEAGAEGVNMASGDGVVRRCHPIFSNYIGDYPEQVAVTLVKTGECPTCPIPAKELGTGRVLRPRDPGPILEALRQIDVGLEEFASACIQAKIKPIAHPFWEDLPYVNIYHSITPDILHQLYQGLVKHIVHWLTVAFGPTEIDARCRRMPLNHNVRFFGKGITHLARVSGKEHADICRILLGLVVDLKLPGGESPARLVRAVRALLDFLYLAKYPVQSTETLNALDEAWTAWHENKSGFSGRNYNFPKDHTPGHYRFYIELYGTTDNYNTENTERLHIDFAKDAYNATNHKDEFPQMTLWLERQEKIFRHNQYITWRISNGVTASGHSPPLHRPHVVMTKHPSIVTVSFDDLASNYGAYDVVNTLVEFVTRVQQPTINRRQLQVAMSQIHLPMRTVSVYHKIRISNPDQYERENAPDVFDIVHAQPARVDTRGRDIAGRFDTVLVRIGDSSPGSISDYRIGQVRVVFTLMPHLRRKLFGPLEPNVATYFAYIEWFSRFTALPDLHHRMYRVSRCYSVDRQYRLAEIIPIDKIKRSIHLFPRFGPSADRSWTSDNVLEQCDVFYVNPFTDGHSYSLL